MHIRRGHIRTQRFGPGWSETKKVWIKDCVVNYDPAEELMVKPRRVSIQQDSASPR